MLGGVLSNFEIVLPGDWRIVITPLPRFGVSKEKNEKKTRLQPRMAVGIVTRNPSYLIINVHIFGTELVLHTGSLVETATIHTAVLLPWKGVTIFSGEQD